MSADLLRLRDRLSERDLAILRSLADHRLMTTRQLQRLHFADGHATVSSATRATTRVLGRLLTLALVDRLERRIGGVRRGSAGYVWQLGSVGERLGRLGSDGSQRRRYVEPGRRFTAHTLGVSELVVRLHEGARAGAFEVLRLESEPTCWRKFLGRHGQTETLKPDLFVVTASGEFEDHRFVEMDLATEHPPAVIRKCQAYQRYAATGTHQAQHGLFPAVVWVVPDTARLEAISGALRAAGDLPDDLFQVVLLDDFAAAMGGDQPAEEPP